MALFSELDIGIKEAAREIKLVIMPISAEVYEQIMTGQPLEISDAMVESRWEVPIQFLSYVRPERYKFCIFTPFTHFY